MYQTQAPPKVFPSLGASHIRERAIPNPRGRTFSVPVKSDLIDEPDETIVVKTRRDKAPDAGEQFSVALFSPTVGWTAYGPGVVTLT
jgi:hypothetical protein